MYHTYVTDLFKSHQKIFLIKTIKFKFHIFRLLLKILSCSLRHVFYFFITFKLMCINLGSSANPLLLILRWTNTRRWKFDCSAYLESWGQALQLFLLAFFSQTNRLVAKCVWAVLSGTPCIYLCISTTDSSVSTIAGVQINLYPWNSEYNHF